MELKYVVMTIVKILISVPPAMLIPSKDANGAALMGGHLDNKNFSHVAPTSDDKSLFEDYEFYDDKDTVYSNPTIEPTNTANRNYTASQISNAGNERENFSEEIPDPSPLVVPGYNLPENIFNRGKPFYLEKDPLTGIINFDSRPTLSDVQEDDFQEYEDTSSKPNIFDKNNIDRKDTASGSHKSSDVNQLVPNFHDFLNLPVKYNSDKYVYPLISSSYANTKVQGNVNKQQNHKNYAHLVTQKPTTGSYYYTSQNPQQTVTKENMDVRPSGGFEPEDEYSYEEYDFTTRANTDHIYLTTSKPTVATTTTAAATTTTTTTTMKPTTTKKTMSLFQQLFGDYDETETEATPSVHYMSDNRHISSTIAPANVHGGSSEYEYQYEDDIVDTSMEKEVKANVTKATSPTTTTTTTTTTPSTTTTTTTMPPPQRHYYFSSEAVTERTTTTTIASKIHNHPTPSRQPESVAYQTVPSTTIHIPAHQNSVSFLVGNHQNVGGEYVGTVVEEKVQMNNRKPGADRDKFVSGNSVNIQPFKHPEASLAIGMPVDRIKVIPGQVVDEKLNANAEEYGKHKIVFPEEKPPGPLPELQPPKLPPNREILKLNSRPMYHQLPSNLTPPKEPNVPLPTKFGSSRPPWDPRPNRFFSGRPEYARPPRPQFDSNLAHKRIDSLPNILPQFRPNVPPTKTYSRVPPVFDKHQITNHPNRHYGMYEKLQPPPPPPKYLTALRKAAFPEQSDKLPKQPPLDQLNYYQTPPQVILPNRRNGNSDKIEVETLQMIQAKQSEKHEVEENQTVENTEAENATTNPEKPLYVVYPVNTAPLKLDAFDTPKKETVVIGTRAELPLPPSKINLEQSDLFTANDRNDAPILKPYLKPIKSDFPYPLEKPNPSLLNAPEPTDTANSVDNTEIRVSPDKPYENRISVTLRTHTEKPIAVAYTPTQSPEKPHLDKYPSVANYAGALISHAGSYSSQHIGSQDSDREFTLTAMLQPQKTQHVLTHRSDVNTDNAPVTAQDFEAPFQASVNIDAASQGWSVVRDKSKAEVEIEHPKVESTTIPLATTSEFDIENFKPQLIGGFVPIYEYPDEQSKSKVVKDRRER